MSIRTLVVDDSAATAGMVQRALQGVDGVEIVGRCSSGRDALRTIAAEQPDLVTLDVDMPGMNGMDVLRAIKRQGLTTAVILLSESGDKEKELARQAAELGAVDFVTRAMKGSEAETLAALRARLAPLAAAVSYRKDVQSLLRGGATAPPVPAPEPAVRVADAPRLNRFVARKKPAMILIGASTGGTEALARIIPKLPGTLSLPVLVVQHMPPLFTGNLAESLNGRSELHVCEARDGDIALGGHVYIAPGGKHLKISTGSAQEIVLHITSDPPENNCRPAVDYLFRSAASAFPGRAVAVILTGMGRDGTAGLGGLKESGCLTIAQDEASCTVFGMPKEAIQAGVIDVVAPLSAIAAEIMKAIR